MSLRKASLAKVRDRLVSVRFNKSASPARINHGGGWDRSNALAFLDDHDLPFKSIDEDDRRFKFRQRPLNKPLGAIEIVDNQFPRGVDVVLEAA